MAEMGDNGNRPVGEDTPSRPVRWDELAWPEIRALLEERPNEVGLLPVGATEQHGPHLPVGTDTIVATAIAEAVSARTAAPVLPSIAVACSFGHGRELPGTLSLTPTGLADAVRAVADWAGGSGLRRLLVLNGHFGNAAALGVASDHVRLERPDLRMGVVGWWEANAEVAAEISLDGDGRARQPGRDVADARRCPAHGPLAAGRRCRRPGPDRGPGVPVYGSLPLDQRRNGPPVRGDGHAGSSPVRVGRRFDHRDGGARTGGGASARREPSAPEGSVRCRARWSGG